MRFGTLHRAEGMSCCFHIDEFEPWISKVEFQPASEQDRGMDSADQKHHRVRITIARWIFIIAAGYGLPAMASWYFVTPNIIWQAARQQPEIYYGFAGVVLAWQGVFLLIAFDPLRYRPLMLLAAFGEKFLFSGMLVILMIRHIARPHWRPFAAIDFLFGAAFLLAFFMTAERRSHPD